MGPIALIALPLALLLAAACGKSDAQAPQARQGGAPTIKAVPITVAKAEVSDVSGNGTARSGAETYRSRRQFAPDPGRSSPAEGGRHHERPRIEGETERSGEVELEPPDPQPRRHGLWSRPAQEGADPAADLEAVHAGQHQFEQDEVGAVLVERGRAARPASTVSLRG